ncbi:hypothetical protein AAMO2058_001477900 [Amorphochlora amoebiformis]
MASSPLLRRKPHLAPSLRHSTRWFSPRSTAFIATCVLIVCSAVLMSTVAPETNMLTGGQNSPRKSEVRSGVHNAKGWMRWGWKRSPVTSEKVYRRFHLEGTQFTILGVEFDGVNVLKTIICPLIGAMLSTLLAFAPLPAIKKAKALKELTTNPAPYPAMFANAANWVVYAFVIKDPFVFIGNLPGMVMGLYYTISAFDVSKNKSHRRIVRKMIYGYALLFPVMTAVLCIIIQNDYITQLVVANFSMICLILFYGAPLVEASNVIREKCSKALDARLAACCIANALMWLIYGIALFDLALIIPNALGIVLAGFQIVLLLIYPGQCEEGGDMKHEMLEEAQKVADAVEQQLPARPEMGMHPAC